MSGPGIALTTPALPTTWMRGDEMPERTCSVAGCDLPYKARGLCKMHYDQARHAGPLALRPTAIERFWIEFTKVDGCWRWSGTIGRTGYAVFWDGQRRNSGHRWAYEHLVGPIPDGLQLDHLCHSADADCLGGLSCPHRRCVNPAHLEPVTGLVNHQRGAPARKTHCAKGHEFTLENTAITKAGYRRCRTCNREYHRLWMEDKKVERLKPLWDAVNR